MCSGKIGPLILVIVGSAVAAVGVGVGAWGVWALLFRPDLPHSVLAGATTALLFVAVVVLICALRSMIKDMKEEEHE